MATDIIAQGLAIKAGKAAQPATIRAAIPAYALGTTLQHGLPPVMASPPTITYGQYRGATAATIAGGGTGYTVGDVLTVVGGTGLVTATTIYVNAVSGGVITAVSINVAGFYTGASGGVPTNAASVTGGTGTGATFNLTYANGSASNRSFGGTNINPDSAAFKITGHNIGWIGAGYGSKSVAGADTIVEFWTDASSITLQFVTSTHSFHVLVDGQRVQASGFTGSASGDYFYLNLNFGSTANRRIVIKGINLLWFGVRMNTSDSVWYPPEMPRSFGYFFGDSYTNMTGAGPGTSFYDATGYALNLDVLGSGVGGTGWKSTSGNDPVTRITAILANLNRAPDFFFIPFGYNDADGTGGATIQSQCQAVLQAVYNKYPNAKIILISPWTPLGNTTNLTYVATYMKAAFDAFVAANPSAWARWISISTIVTSGNASRYTGGDNVHANGNGHILLGDRIAQLCAPQLWQ